MTVEELIKKLKDMPANAVVLREFDEYRDGTTKVRSVSHQEKSTFGREGNTVLIK